MNGPVTPERLEEALANYVLVEKGDKSPNKQKVYVDALREAFEAVDWYHEHHPGKRDREHDYILCAKAIKDLIDKDYRRRR